MILYSKKAAKIITAQNPGQGYGGPSHYNEWADMMSERYVGDSGTSPWSRVNNNYRERVMDYRNVIDEGMRSEWGEDKGVKPSGTQVRKKKKRRKRGKKKDLGYITEYERINRSNPKSVGRVQNHWRRKNDYSPGRTPPGNRGAWPWMRENWPKLPSWEPETWSERTQRDMFL